MDRVVLGRTGLEVSVAGLGCGGHSRLGLSYGRSESDAEAVVRRALDLGVTFVDTARAYRTEEVVGRGIAGRRDDVVLSSKALIETGDGVLPATELRASVEKSLTRLATDRIDVFHLHGVRAEVYDQCLDDLVPALLAMKDEGKIRFLAISEAFATDPGHVMLSRAVGDDCWDVMMVGFNLLNPSARERVFPGTEQAGIGVLVMFAVRTALSRDDELRRVVGQLVEEGHVEPAALDAGNPLGFLVGDGGAASVIEAAYRFARHEPGTHVVLTGTGSVDHLEHNIAAIDGPPLPDAHSARLHELFGAVDHVSSN